MCVTANKLAVLRREGRDFAVEQTVGASKVRDVEGIPGRNAAAICDGTTLTLFALPEGGKPKKVGTVATTAFRLRGEADRLYATDYYGKEAWEVVDLDDVPPRR